MRTSRDHWSDWADLLRRHHLDGFAAWLLEAGGPLALLGAQALYFGRPFLGDQADALAQALESGDEIRAFASFLEEGGR